MTFTRGPEELFVLPPILTSGKGPTFVWLSIKCFYFWKNHVSASLCCTRTLKVPQVLPAGPSECFSTVLFVLLYHHSSCFHAVLLEDLAELIKLFRLLRVFCTEYDTAFNNGCDVFLKWGFKQQWIWNFFSMWVVEAHIRSKSRATETELLEVGISFAVLSKLPKFNS